MGTPVPVSTTRFIVRDDTGAGLGAGLRRRRVRGSLQVVLGPVHAGPAVEGGAAGDHERRRLDVAVQAPGRVDDDLARRDDVAHHRAADLDRARADRRGDRPALGDRHRLCALELAAELALDRDRLRDDEPAAHLHPARDERRVRLARNALRFRLRRRRALDSRAGHQTSPTRSTRRVHHEPPATSSASPRRLRLQALASGGRRSGLRETSSLLMSSFATSDRSATTVSGRVSARKRSMRLAGGARTLCRFALLLLSLHAGEARAQNEIAVENALPDNPSSEWEVAGAGTTEN